MLPGEDTKKKQNRIEKETKEMRNINTVHKPLQRNKKKERQEASLKINTYLR